MISTLVVKELHCTNCTATLHREGEQLADITVMNAARDAKWMPVNGRWLCPKCVGELKSWLKAIGMRIDEHGTVVPEKSKK